MPKMCAKMNLSHIVTHEHCEQLHFKAVCKPGGYPADGLDEDNTFATFSPQADMTITITNPTLIGRFKEGEKYYVDFTVVSPAAAFDETYRPATGMPFGLAIEALKKGMKVARAGWNGKGMYLWLLPAAMVKSEWCREPHLKAVAEANGGEIEALGTIRMMTADKKVLTGWLASQSDMLADDWAIVE